MRPCAPPIGEGARDANGADSVEPVGVLDYHALQRAGRGLLAAREGDGADDLQHVLALGGWRIMLHEPAAYTGDASLPTSPAVYLGVGDIVQQGG